MSSYTANFLKPYNFDAALRLTVKERFAVCIERIEQSLRQTGYAQFVESPPIPPNSFTQQEIEALERRIDMRLPGEYAQFLRNWSYLDIDIGLRIGDAWISEQHRPPYKYLIFGDYWKYADGDQLMFDLNITDAPVVVYLHEHGPLIEYFAPSFSLTLWRIVDEKCR